MTLACADVALRLLGSDDSSPAVELHAARALAAALVEGKLVVPIGARFALEEIAAARDAIERGSSGRFVLAI